MSRKKDTELTYIFLFLFLSLLFINMQGIVERISTHLRRSRLGVVRLEVALEIQNLELIALAEREELAERGIGLDNLLVHQVVGLGVRADAAGDLRAAEERALAQAEEGAERIRDGDRLREDSLLLRAIRGTLRLTAAAALGGLLELTGNLLLELLHVREDRGERGAERVHLLNERGELGRDVDLLGGGLRGRGGDDGGRRRNRRGDGRSGSRLGGLGGRSGDDGCRGRNGGGCGNSGGLAGLGDFGRCRRHFYIGVWGSFCGKQTRGYAFITEGRPSVNFDAPGGRKLPKSRDAAYYLVCFPT